MVAGAHAHAIRWTAIATAVASTAAAVATAATGPGSGCIGAYAGVGTGVGDARVVALGADVDLVTAVAPGNFGELYVADSSGSWVRVLLPDGTLGAFAGGASAGHNGDGGPAVLALLAGPPRAVAVTPGGDVIIADTNNGVVRVVFAANATIATLAGGPRFRPALTAPYALAVDAGGSVYVADAGAARVLLVSATSGAVTVVAGTGASGAWPGDGGAATATALLSPRGLALRADGALLVADVRAIRVVSANGTASTLDDGGAGFAFAADVAVDPSDGSALVADHHRHVVWRLRAGARAVVVAGTPGVKGTTGDGGPATAAAINGPVKLAVVGGGVVLAELGGTAVRRVDLRTGAITVLAGTDSAAAASAVRADFAVLDGSDGLAVGAGATYVMARPGVLYRLDTSTWLLSVVAGNGLAASAGDGGAATAAALHVYDSPVNGTARLGGGGSGGGGGGGSGGSGSGGGAVVPEACEMGWGDIAVSPRSGDVLLAEGFGRRIRRVSVAAGTITTAVGSGEPAGAFLPPRPGGAPPAAAAIGSPGSVAIDGATDDVYFVYGITIPACNFSLGVGAYGVWGVGVLNASTALASHVACARTGAGYAGDGGPATAALCCEPWVGGVDARGAVFIADSCNNVVRVVDPGTGTIRTLVGTGAPGFGGDGGPASLATLAYPTAVRVVGARVFINDQANGRIRVVGGDGVIATVAGVGVATDAITGNGGAPTAASLGLPWVIAVDGAGNVHMGTDTGGQLRVAVLGSWAPCPAGYACACGTPVPCTDPSTFCPGNTLAAAPVAAGFFTTPRTAAAPRTAQAPCPPGHFCDAGAIVACFAGSFRADVHATAAADCVQCPPGTYSARDGETSAAACVPCPSGSFAVSGGAAFCAPCGAGTFKPAPQAANASACTPCPPGTVSFTGAAACVDATASRFAVAASTETLESDAADLRAVPAPAFAARVATATASAVVAVALLPLFVAGAYAACVAASPAVLGPRCRRDAACVRVWLRRMDACSLAHRVREGGSPVKRPTTCGGVTTVLAAATIAALCAALVVHFREDNAIVQRGVSPTTLAALAAMVATAPYARGVSGGATHAGAAHAAGSAGAPPPCAGGIAACIASGVTLELSVMGPDCAALTWASAGIDVDDFAHATATDAATLESVHTFTCAACAFTALSALTTTFAPSCQAVRVRAAAVSAEGVVVATAVAGNGSAYRAGAGPGAVLLSRLDVALAPTLELFTDAGTGASARGYGLAVTAVAPQFEAAPAAVTVSVSLALAPFYVTIDVVPLQSQAQLLSSLAGLLGLTSVFALAFVASEFSADAQDAAQCAAASVGCGRQRRGVVHRPTAAEVERQARHVPASPLAAPHFRRLSAASAKFTDNRPFDVAASSSVRSVLRSTAVASGRGSAGGGGSHCGTVPSPDGGASTTGEGSRAAGGSARRPPPPPPPPPPPRGPSPRDHHWHDASASGGDTATNLRTPRVRAPQPALAAVATADAAATSGDSEASTAAQLLRALTRIEQLEACVRDAQMRVAAVEGRIVALSAPASAT